MLRIEDTDAARSSDESAKGIMEDLAWLGIEWDDGPKLTLADGRVIGANARDVGGYFQARRKHIYNAEIERLVRLGRAYPGFEKTEDLDAKRKAAVAAKQTYRYERPGDVVAGVFNEARWARAVAGEAHVIRFLALSEEIVVADQVLGDVKIAAGELDDFVIRKADGFPTYHFAVVVDDETMGTTHVLRAQEHLANTPRHVAMQKALGYRVPVYGHMPLIFNMDGTKMSKRDKAKAARKATKDAMVKDKTVTPAGLAGRIGVSEPAITDFLAAQSDSIEVAEALAAHFGVALPEVEVWDFRRNGYLPEAICNFIGLLGWNPGMKLADGKDLEKFDNAFIAKHFAMERIGRTNAKFDRNKLLSFNADAIGAMTDDAFADRWVAWMNEHEPAAAKSIARLDRGRLLILAKALRPRAKTLRDALRPAAFVMVGDADYPFDPAAVEKNLNAADKTGAKLLAEFKPRLEAIGDWTAEAIHGAIEVFAREKGMPNPGGISQPLRVAVTGTGVSPGLGETLAVLGKASTLARIGRCLETVK